MPDYIGNSDLFNGLEQGLRYALTLLETVDINNESDKSEVIRELKRKREFAIECRDIRKKHEIQMKKFGEMMKNA